MTDEMTTYQLEPIDAATATRLRAEGGVRYTADAMPGYPCRQCLQDAEIGESLILVAHDPFDEGADTAYRSSSPIFLHETSCEPPTDLSDLPKQLTVRQLSVRAFDQDAMMVDAAVIDGTSLDRTLQQFFSNGEVDQIHVHNASRGCWATTIRRDQVRL